MIPSGTFLMKLLLARSRDNKFVKFNPRGKNGPSRLLFDNFKIRKSLLHFPNYCGKYPDKLLYDKSRLFNCLISPNEVGKLPCNELEDMLKNIKLGKFDLIVG